MADTQPHPPPVEVGTVQAVIGGQAHGEEGHAAIHVDAMTGGAIRLRIGDAWVHLASEGSDDLIELAADASLRSLGRG